MRVPHSKAVILSVGAVVVTPAVLLAPAATHLVGAVGVVSFWVTLGLAVAGSAFSAFCIASPISEPKLEPYSFIGQWFIWLATPLLWGIVAVSLALTWLRHADLLAVLAALAISRWGAQAMCNLKWRGSSARRVPTMPYLPRAQRHS